jgi:hypothetical protein
MEKANENRAWFFNDDENFSERVYVMYDKKIGQVDYFVFKQGKEVDITNFKPLIFNVEKTKQATLDYLLKWDFLPNSTGLLLANEKAIEILQAVAAEDFQALPTEIRMYDGTIIKNYSLINITKRKDVLNKVKSILLPEEKRSSWRMYKTSLYDKDCLCDYNFTRIDHTVLFLTSDNVKRAIEVANLTGIKFQDSWGGEDFIE